MPAIVARIRILNIGCSTRPFSAMISRTAFIGKIKPPVFIQARNASSLEGRVERPRFNTKPKTEFEKFEKFNTGPNYNTEKFIVSLRGFANNYNQSNPIVDEEPTQSDESQTPKKAEFVSIPGFSYFDSESIESIRERNKERIKDKFAQHEQELLQEDLAKFNAEIEMQEKRIDYLKKNLLPNVITFENMDEKLDQVVNNQVCYCYAIDKDGKKLHGYARDPKKPMVSIWELPAHPASQEDMVFTPSIMRHPIKRL